MGFYVSVDNQNEGREGFQNEWGSMSQWIINPRIERGSRTSGVPSPSG